MCRVWLPVWDSRGRIGRDEKGKAWLLASGIEYLASGMRQGSSKKLYTSLLTVSVHYMHLEICLIGCGVGRMSLVPDYCPLGISGGRVNRARLQRLHV